MPTARWSSGSCTSRKPAAENRALVELRLNGGRWALDSYLRHGTAQLTLLDPSRTHAVCVWQRGLDDVRRPHACATTSNGVEQGSGDVTFRPLVSGQTSIGVRQNRVSWFKGRIHTVRVTPSVLRPSQFLPVPTQVDPDLAGGRAAPPRRCGARAGRRWPCHQRPRSVADLLRPGARHGDRHRGDRLRRRQLRAPGDGQRSGGRDRSADPPRHRRVRAEVSAGRTTGIRHRSRTCSAPSGWCDRARQSSASAPIASGCSAPRRADTSRRRRPRISTRRKGAPARRSIPSPRVRTSSRCCIPVVTMKAPHAHADSRRNLLGDTIAAPLIDRFSIEGAGPPRHAAVLRRPYERRPIGADREQPHAGRGAGGAWHPG